MHEYKLRSHDLVSARSRQLQLFRDLPDEYAAELQTRVASGDYFIVLATQLDLLSQELAETDPNAQMQLERIITDLAYLHARYEIHRK